MRTAGCFNSVGAYDGVVSPLQSKLPGTSTPSRAASRTKRFSCKNCVINRCNVVIEVHFAENERWTKTLQQGRKLGRLECGPQRYSGSAQLEAGIIGHDHLGPVHHVQGDAVSRSSGRCVAWGLLLRRNIVVNKERHLGQRDEAQTATPGVEGGEGYALRKIECRRRANSARRKGLSIIENFPTALCRSSTSSA